jgi:hypothetical protein
MDKPDAVITREQAEDLAKRYSTPERPIPVYFTSSKANTGVTEAFEGLATLALQHNLAKQADKPKAGGGAAAAGAIKLDSGKADAEGKGGCGSC